MRRFSALVVTATMAMLFVAVPGMAKSIAPSTQPTAGAGGATAATVVKTSRVAPPRSKVVRKRFSPWAKPSPRRVRQIIRWEAKRWGISPSRLARRVGCESGFRWHADSGTYKGLLQFAPSTFSRGMRSIKSRGVKIKRVRKRKVSEVHVARYSDGRVVRTKGRKRVQRVTVVYKGQFPRNPSVTHGWAQLRIGAQAIAGRSAVSSGEWGCPA